MKKMQIVSRWNIGLLTPLFAIAALGLEQPKQGPQPAMATLASPLTPEEELATFRLEPGLRAELVAAEPVVVAPVAMAFDERGRMYVAENRGYPTGPGEGKPPAGRITLLEDSAGDGRFRKRTVFAEGLTFPNGIMPWKGGVYITCAPDLLYLKDTDGDGRADIRRVVLTGFATTGSTQLRVSHPTLGIDNWVYLASGLVGGQITAPEFPNHPAVDITRTDLRFRPDAGDFEQADGKAQFGLTFDDFGHRFNCMNRVHIRHIVLPARYLRRNSQLAFSETMQNIPESMMPEPLKGHGAAARVYPISHNITTADSHAGTFTAACGVLVYRGTALPEQYRGQAFSCEPTGNLIHWDQLLPAGATFSARRAQAGVEFLASSDDWFRPVFLANAPDGALYICDMYRKTIEHPDYLPVEIRKHTDFVSGKDKGRIYRVVGTAEKRASGNKPVNLASASVKNLCAELSNPNAWWRETAQRLLVERQDPAAVPLLRSALPDPNSAVQVLHALHALDGLNALDNDSIQRALAHRHPAVREQAIQLAESHLANSSELAARVIALAEDPEARVRFQCALTLGELGDARILPGLAKIARRDAGDRWTRAAVLSSLRGRADAFFKELIPVATAGGSLAPKAKDSGSSGSDLEEEGWAALMAELGRLLGAGQLREKLAASLEEILAFERPEDAFWQAAALHGFAEGLRSRGVAAKDQAPLLSVLRNSKNAGSAEQRLRSLIADSRAVAADPKQPLAARLAAVHLLSQSEFASTGAQLLALLDPHVPAVLQSTAVRSLAQMPEGGVGAALLARERWESCTPPVRESVLAALLSQPRHLPAVLRAIEAGDIPPSALDPARRNQLMQHKDAAIRQRATALFQNMQAGDRMKVYDDYKSMLVRKANPKNGRAVFKQHCASCHRLDREGVAVGPDLFGIRNQPKEAILMHILIPEYEIAPGFAGYVVETKDGRTLSALIASETATSITIRRALGEEETILRSNLEAISASTLSLMPQELEKNMSRQDLADLIAYLKGEDAGE